jgi:hypothetical protein
MLDLPTSDEEEIAELCAAIGVVLTLLAKRARASRALD